jgi:hypothetical protein
MEIYRNIGKGRRYVDGSRMCMAGNVTALNSTRLEIQLYNINRTSEFEASTIMYGDIDENGKTHIHAGTVTLKIF